jgi:predicted O-linked N-acetylglucosamine transferase (SPINDLY family)
MQYYISWGAAELPIEQSQKHYTEQLKLLPSDIVYQYYEPRILPGGRSRADGMSFGNIGLEDFNVPTDKNIYLCMQKPFKFHPEVDVLLCGIMQKDPGSWLILHRESANQEVFANRLKKRGCDLSRITFLEAQPHHRLLALYRDSTVILDSYPAGGDTTTREVLEMGKALVTLPARLLGGRWSVGYMHTIGLEKQTIKRLVASTPKQYIDLAVKLGTDKKLRYEVEADIRAKVQNLFHRYEAVAAWQHMFLEISPYQQCGKCGNSTYGTCSANSA